MESFEHPPVAFPPVLPGRHPDAPAAADLDKCIHCGLCLNACPTYRELGIEMDSPRGRIYQMVQVATGQAPVTESYVRHLDLCLACRACESACPSGVPYGRMIEAARAELHAQVEKPWLERTVSDFVFGRILVSRGWLKVAGALLYLYQSTGLRTLVQGSGILKLFGKLGRIEHLAPSVDVPFFFDNIGRVFPAEGERRYRVALLSGCIANVAFARLNEATVRVLQKNGCEVVLPANQGCCGALHAHAGRRDEARALARRNIDACLSEPFDAIITNTAGCGSTLKEYHELLEHDAAYAEKARQFVGLMRDINEFLATAGLRAKPGPLAVTVTYQDSCHLLHGQKIRNAPRELLRAIPGLVLKEMPLADHCCGSAGIYNVVQDEMANDLIAKKIPLATGTGADVIATANPGCMLQLRAGVEKYGRGQRVAHVIELLDEAYRFA
jgi:glycolate oxidase iron-sulfur subunit